MYIHCDSFYEKAIFYLVLGRWKVPLLHILSSYGWVILKLTEERLMGEKKQILIHAHGDLLEMKPK